MDRVGLGSAPVVERRRLQISGTVQGVGFRPLVFRLAVANHLGGWVCNRRGAVTVEVEGAPAGVVRFLQQLQAETAPPARIDQMQMRTLAPIGYTQFSIQSSEPEGGPAPLFPPDLAVCPACRADGADAESRFFRYPFTSCTYCGPRFSIAQSLPYDRAATSMAAFSLCEPCAQAYADPGDRRFHAQTLACPRCGPHIRVRRTTESGRLGPNEPAPGGRPPAQPQTWQQIARAALASGAILAVKGVGGFHLVCDAANRQAIVRLRQRKRRPRKPFAVMARNLDTVEADFGVVPGEREALTETAAPIVLLTPKHPVLPLGALAPGQRRLGVMLPYTILHDLLLTDLSYLVMTSGNAGGLPIARTNEEALAQLQGIADLFLLHDREIIVRVEDSVCQVVNGRRTFIRRARGYVPEPLTVPAPAAPDPPVVFAGGAEWKNTCCLLRGDQALLSQHLGDLQNQEQLACWIEGARHLLNLFAAEPDLIAYDPHPAYRVSAEARRLFPEAVAIPVYHHHAHLAACMAEHGLTAPVIGCILDGTGYGPDGTLWGFEILAGDYAAFERICHLEPIALPGGEAAIRKPWLTAVSLLHKTAPVRELFPEYEAELPLVLAQLDGRLPCPSASSAGRLFDGVAALLGLCRESSYDGEAAALLGEAVSERAPTADRYPIQRDGAIWRTAPLMREIVREVGRGVAPVIIARKFHHTVAAMVCEGARLAREQTGRERVVLSGGVWQNRYLLACTVPLLKQQGFEVYTHQRVPPGDGGISLGQAVSARWRWERHVSCGSRAGAAGGRGIELGPG